ELAIVAAGTTAQPAAVAMLDRELARRLRLDLLGLGRHARLTHTWKIENSITVPTRFCLTPSMAARSVPAASIAARAAVVSWSVNRSWRLAGTAGRSGGVTRGPGRRSWPRSRW